jgi:hypothetical protein
MPTASTIADWLTLMRAAETLNYTRVVPWGEGLWYAEFEVDDGGRLCRNIVIEGGAVRTKEDSDV